MPPKSRRNRERLTEEEVLTNTRDDMGATVKELTAAIGSLQHKVRRQEVSDGVTIGRVSPTLKWVLLITYVLAGYSVACAESYWAQKRRQQKLTPYLPAETSRFIEDLFLNEDVDQIWNVIDDDVGLHRGARQQAFAWHAKWRLQVWVGRKNVEKGLAVLSHSVTKQYNAFLLDIPFILRPAELRDPRDDGYARVFLNRWRHAFRTKWGRIRVQERIPLEEKRAKAQFLVKREHFWTLFRPANGYIMTPPKWARFLAPNSGPPSPVSNTWSLSGGCWSAPKVRTRKLML